VLVPGTTRVVAVLDLDRGGNAETVAKETEAAARAMGLQIWGENAISH
jgi:hypothetical protein